MSTPGASLAPPSPRVGRARLRGRLADVRVWASLALAFSLLGLAVNGPEGSVLWFLSPLLLAGFLLGVWRDRPWRRKLAGRRAAVAFVVLSWLTGMLYELTLSDQGAAFGGLARTTAASFVLAQAWYPLFALLGLWFVRRYDLGFRQVFFLSGVASIFEIAISGVLLGVVASPLVVLAPLVLGYYMTVYGMLLAWPLLLVDERSLWSGRGRRASRTRTALLGIAAGAVCWLCFGGLALLLAEVAPGFVPEAMGARP